ncbi:tobamovirus multiplication 2A [Euphorbia peplus]|nr:tobamovirus multiplication 2A [Euphorbia peplus]
MASININISTATTILRCLMKMVNFVMAMAGFPLILYGLWLLRVWERDMEDSPIDVYNSTSPWFSYAVLSIGITLCFTTCLGHISADSCNSFCLCCYTVSIFVLLLVEMVVAAYFLLNPDWEKDLPEDPTGRLHDFREFVHSNFDVFKWILFLILLAQGSSVLLAMGLRAVVDNYMSNYENDDSRVPLINHSPSCVVGDPYLSSKNAVPDVKEPQRKPELLPLFS